MIMAVCMMFSPLPEESPGIYVRARARRFSIRPVSGAAGHPRGKTGCERNTIKNENHFQAFFFRLSEGGDKQRREEYRSGTEKDERTGQGA